jgi:hypothetical protein
MQREFREFIKRERAKKAGIKLHSRTKGTYRRG